MTNTIIESVEKPTSKRNPQFEVGDTVDVATRIIEGEKERIQIFAGTVIMKKGRGMNETFTVRRIVNNEGVERIFPINSPFISKVTVRRSGETRRAKLFYLRDRVGKPPAWPKFARSRRKKPRLMWWAIACDRAYAITHDPRYLKKSKASFDFVYDHFLDTKFGGGLYWINQRTSKNSCLNSPAVIAAVRLSVFLKDPSYLAKAKSLYAWQKKTLTDGTGKVFDSISSDRARQTTRIGRFSLTYNQGTFIGAAVLLYQQTKDKTYLDDAIKTAQWTKDNLCVTDQYILHDEGQGDGGAFKGIFVRYMKLLINDCGRTEFLPWMKANADTAWRNRRPADNIMGNDWTVLSQTSIQSQTDTSAVAVILCFADPKP
jgi:ribosomal protein L19